MDQQLTRELLYKYKFTNFALFCAEIIKVFEKVILSNDVAFSNCCMEYTATFKVDKKTSVRIILDSKNNILSIDCIHNFGMFSHKLKNIIEKNTNIYNISEKLKILYNYLVLELHSLNIHIECTDKLVSKTDNITINLNITNTSHNSILIKNPCYSGNVIPQMVVNEIVYTLKTIQNTEQCKEETIRLKPKEAITIRVPVIIKKNMFGSEEYSLFFIIKLDDKNTVYSNTLKLP